MPDKTAPRPVLKIGKVLLLTFFLIAIHLSCRAGFAHIDSMFAYQIPVNGDTADVYLVIKHHYNSSCYKQGSAASIADDSAFVKICYAIGSLLVVCPRVDTFYIGPFVHGQVFITAIIYTGSSPQCESYYSADTGTLAYQGLEVGLGETVMPGIIIFPNPVKDNLTLSDPYRQISLVTLITVEGQIILQKPSSGETLLPVDVSNLPTNIYFLAVKTLGGRTIIKKIVKD